MSKVNQYKYYDVILALFVAVLLISNISATKLIAFGPIIADGGAVLFPMAYISGDILTEVYGYKYARRAIWTGFVIMLLATVSFYVVQQAPPAAEWNNQEAFASVVGFFPRIVFASLCAYLVGEFINAFLLAKLKIITKGKKLWLRLIGSTFFGQFADTIVFSLVAFGGLLDASTMIRFIAIGWLFKTGVEIILLPVTYRTVNYLKRVEGVDAYDKKTDFNPLQAQI